MASSRVVGVTNDGDKTQTVLSPKAARVEALEETLDGLVDDASEPALTRIERARRHLRAFRGEGDGL